MTKCGREGREGGLAGFVLGPCHLIKMRNSLPEMSISANDRGDWGGDMASGREGGKVAHGDLQPFV